MITGGCHAADIARYLGAKWKRFPHAVKNGRILIMRPPMLAVRFANGSVGKISASLDGLYFPYQFNIDL